MKSNSRDDIDPDFDENTKSSDDVISTCHPKPRKTRANRNKPDNTNDLDNVLDRQPKIINYTWVCARFFSVFFLSFSVFELLNK